MKIAIMSDTHDNLVNFKSALGHCEKNKINKIIFCGDLTSVETMIFLINNFKGDILLAFGNGDFDELKDYAALNKDKRIKYHNNFGTAVLAKMNIAFSHFPGIAKKLANTGKYNFVFYGHTHKPWEERVGSARVICPGNISGFRYEPTFSIWDTSTNEFELVRIFNLKK